MQNSIHEVRWGQSVQTAVIRNKRTGKEIKVNCLAGQTVNDLLDVIFERESDNG